MCGAFIERYDVTVQYQFKDKVSSDITKATKARIAKEATFEDVLQLDNDDPNVMEMNLHDSEMMVREKEVPTFVLSPVVNITWLYLLEPFRQLMDFNFKRPSNWTDDSPVLRFNDCWYVSMHHVLDWHDFALLSNGSLLHKGVIIQTPASLKAVVYAIKYEIPDTIKNATSRSDFVTNDREKFWKGKAIMYYKKLKETKDYYILRDRQYTFELDASDKLQAISIDALRKPIRNRHGKEIEIHAPTQHRHVAACKPFFFSILGSDEYHHTTFTGKNDSDTHGIYWWFANMAPDTQFTRQMTMIMGQLPHDIPTHIMAKIVYKQWIDLMENGLLLWTGHKFRKAYGMVSHQIMDMKESDVFRRRRGSNKKSRCDGMLWLGYYHGCKWPDSVNDLMQLGIIMPGPYLLKLWKHLNFKCVPRLWNRFPNNLGKQITLTTAATDVYNEVPLASSLKTPTELNHTAWLGCATKACKIEWYKAHLPKNLNAKKSRILINVYLQKYFHNINGMSSIIMRDNTKISVFNQMHQNWQKLIELLIALPTCLCWFGNIPLLTSLIRVIGLLFSVKSENERKRVQRVLIPILQASLVPLRLYG